MLRIHAIHRAIKTIYDTSIRQERTIPLIPSIIETGIKTTKATRTQQA